MDTQFLGKLEDRLGKDDPEQRVLAAAVARLEGDYDEAVELYTTLAKETPGYSARAHFEIGVTELTRERVEAAIAALRRAVSLAKGEDMVALLQELAAALVRFERAPEALAIVKEHIGRFPDRPYLELLQAEMELLNKRLGAALRTARTLMEKYSDFMPPYLFAARVSRLSGDPNGGAAILRQALERKPANIAAWVELANLQVLSGDLPQAEATLKSGLQRNPGNFALMYEVATIIDEAGRQDEANTRYREILAAHGTHPETVHNLVTNLSENESGVAEAVQVAQVAYRDAERDPVVQDAYGWALLKSGRKEAALPILERASKALSEYGFVQYHLGLAYLESGRLKDAKAMFSKALEAGVSEAMRADIRSRTGQ